MLRYPAGVLAKCGWLEPRQFVCWVSRHGVLGPFMLRRVKDVVAGMVPKTEVILGYGTIALIPLSEDGLTLCNCLS
jgi:hypothetical protein